MDVSLVSILPSIGEELPGAVLAREEVDFISGELVTTGSGYQFKGTFGELSEKQNLTNGYTFDGAFYE